MGLPEDKTSIEMDVHARCAVVVTTTVVVICLVCPLSAKLHFDF